MPATHEDSRRTWRILDKQWQTTFEGRRLVQVNIALGRNMPGAERRSVRWGELTYKLDIALRSGPLSAYVGNDEQLLLQTEAYRKSEVGAAWSK